MLVIPNQAPGVETRYALTRTQLDATAWTVEPDGRRASGAAAINRVLSDLGAGWPLLAAAYRLPPVATVEEAAYRWVARNRSRLHRFGVTPECDDPARPCRE